MLYCCISTRRNFQWENGNYMPNVRAIYRSSWYLIIGVAPSTVPLSSFPSLTCASSSKDWAWDLGIRQVWVPVQVLLFTDPLPSVWVCSFVKWTLWKLSYAVVCTTHWHHEPNTNHSKKEIHNKTKVHTRDPWRSTQTWAWAMQIPQASWPVNLEVFARSSASHSYGWVIGLVLIKVWLNSSHLAY